MQVRLSPGTGTARFASLFRHNGHRGRSVGSTRHSIPNAFQGNGYDYRCARWNTKKNTITVKQPNA